MSPFERLRGAHLTGHPVIEDLVFSVLSVLVLTVAIVAVTMPSQPTIALAVDPVTGKAAPNEIGMYGTLLEQDGTPIRNALITLRNPSGTIVAWTLTAADGSWDFSHIGPAGNYTVRVTVFSGGWVQGQTTIAATPGTNWGIRMILTEPSSWTFVPLPGY